MNYLPSDPMMLLSFINMKLRDQYSSLSALADDMDVSESDIIDKLAAVDYHYNAELNKFV